MNDQKLHVCSVCGRKFRPDQLTRFIVDQGRTCFELCYGCKENMPFDWVVKEMDKENNNGQRV